MVLLTQHFEYSLVNVLVDKAIADKQLFIGFDHIRGKTGALSRLHLTPEAVESLKAYLDTTDPNNEFLWMNGTGKSYITNDTINNILKSMVEAASIQTIGTVRFHLLRKFTISALLSAGVPEPDMKLMVGKEVDPSLATYLTGNKERLMEEFQNAYPRLSLTGYANRNHDRIQELEETIKRQAEQISLLLQALSLAAPREKAEQIRKIIMQAKKLEPKNVKSRED